MSGGYLNYVHSRLRDETRGRLVFPILEELRDQFCDVLESVELATSGDTSVEDARNDLLAFLERWGIDAPAWRVEPRSCANCIHCTVVSGSFGDAFQCDSAEAAGEWGSDSEQVERGTAAGCCRFYGDMRVGDDTPGCMPGRHNGGDEP